MPNGFSEDQAVKHQKHFQRRVLERFMTPEELDVFIREYHKNAGGRAISQIQGLRFGLHRAPQKYEVPVKRGVK